MRVDELKVHVHLSMVLSVVFVMTLKYFRWSIIYFHSYLKVILEFRNNCKYNNLHIAMAFVGNESREIEIRDHVLAIGLR